MTSTHTATISPASTVTEFRQNLLHQFNVQTDFLLDFTMSIEDAFDELYEDGHLARQGNILDTLKHAFAYALFSIIDKEASSHDEMKSYTYVYPDMFLGSPGGFYEAGSYWIEAQSFCNYKSESGVINSVTSGRVKLNKDTFINDDLLSALLTEISKNVSESIHNIPSS